MSVTKLNPGSNNQAITCSLAPAGVGLANGNARASAAIDNTSNLFTNVLVFVGIKSGSTGTSASGTVSVYAYGTVDGGSHYTEGATGSDGSITLTVPTNLRFLGSINVVTDATTFYGGPWPLEQAFGNVVPDHWGIVIVNNSGHALDTTEANHFKLYQGFTLQNV